MYVQESSSDEWVYSEDMHAWILTYENPISFSTCHTLQWVVGRPWPWGSSEAVHFSQAFTALTVIFVYYEQYIEEENVSYQTKYYVVKVCNIVFLKIDTTGNYGASLTEDFMMTPQLGDFAQRFLPLINEQNILL